TNNRMEMMALLSALKAMKREGLVIHVYSDSSYLMDCFRKKWYVNWKKNGWKTSQKTDVENKDLWVALLDEVKKHQVSFYRVKGHVNLDHPSTNVEGHFQKFLEWNGNGFTKQDFMYVTAMNNRADKLANIAMDEIRDKNQLL
ncbi:MAG: ribonuclease HI, partial [Firmicutes bacterium]|nr:ribonuclease HI [Bacillota bacterium]